VDVEVEVLPFRVLYRDVARDNVSPIQDSTNGRSLQFQRLL
jgi:hypothetical protein